METFQCYYDVTAKINEIARQHAEQVAPVLYGNGSTMTVDIAIAGLSHYDGKNTAHYFRVYECADHLSHFEGETIEWFNTKDELRSAIMNIGNYHANIHGSLVVAELATKSGSCSKITFYGVNDLGKTLRLVNGKSEVCDDVVIDPENLTRTDRYGFKCKIFLNPAEMADELWDYVQQIVANEQKYIKNAFDLRRKELGSSDRLLSAIRNAQMKNK